MELFTLLAMSADNPTLFEAISAYLLLYGTHALRPTAANVPLNAVYMETDTGDGFQNQAGTWVKVMTTTGGGGGGVLTVTATTPLTTDLPDGDITLSHDDSGVTAGVYGDDTHVAQITVDAKGHVTDVVDVEITGGGGGGGTPNFFGIQNFTAPPTTGWSWDNQDSSTVDEQATYIRLYNAGTGHDQLSVRYRSAPGSTPWTITAFLLNAGFPYSSAVGLPACGICFRQSSDGKIVELNVGQYNANAPYTRTNKHTNATSSGSTVADNQGTIVSGPYFWMRLTNDGTNLKTWISLDGLTWWQSWSEAVGTYITPDQVGLVLNNYAKSGLTLLHWEVT
jgi:hypothetical protein